MCTKFSHGSSKLLHEKDELMKRNCVHNSVKLKKIFEHFIGPVNYIVVIFSRLQEKEDFICLCRGFMTKSTIRSCRAGQLVVVLFLGRLRPSKRLTSTKRGRPRQ